MQPNKREYHQGTQQMKLIAGKQYRANQKYSEKIGAQSIPKNRHLGTTADASLTNGHGTIRAVLTKLKAIDVTQR